MGEHDNPTVWDGKRLRAPHAQSDKADRVRRMFDGIAPTYELVNTLFSAGQDARWRRRAVELAKITPDDLVLDIACGTGDLARAMATAGPRAVVGCDFSHEMLRHAVDGPPPAPPRPSATDSTARDSHHNGARACRAAPIRYIEADALHLPAADASFTVTSCAFGVRNLRDPSAGFAEMLRVLTPGGRTVILEFTRPSNAGIRAAYEFYSGKIMPTLATWISGDRTGAYRYLPRSVVSFPGAAALTAMLLDVGFDTVRTAPLTFGAVTVYIAYKALDG